jgi:phosphohistidine swiveling domain-containing protein
MAQPVDPRLERELEAASALGDRLVVRSSSGLDDDGTMAGAFASFGDVRPHELSRAVRGCWSSAYAPATLDRLERRSVEPQDVGLAVLIQRQVDPALGGWASIDDDTIEVAVTTGSPAPLLQGHVNGERSVFARHDGGHADTRSPLLAGVAHELVRILRQAGDALGPARVEWASDGHTLTILQVTPGDRPHVAMRSDVTGYVGPAYERLARMLVCRRGPVADRLLTPWAAFVDVPMPTSRSAGTGTVSVEALATIVEMADRLNESAAVGAGMSVGGLRDALTFGRPIAGVSAVPGLDPVAAGALVVGIDELASGLVARGLLLAPHAMWSQPWTWLVAAVAGSDSTGAARPRGDLWEPLMEAVLHHSGSLRKGNPASVGRAVGRAVRVDDQEGIARVTSGDIAVATHPTPALAPLLWDCEALVTENGSIGAHLFEVARALHRPAVAGVGPIPRLEAIVSVDGETGETRWWPA